jgi:hypothetical protein
MTGQTRSTRARRPGRRPGWLLLTALLVLAIGASSALVFTNRVELLKLAVILALWAAVVTAFVSVVYRRQSETEQAKVRDLKMVYDLQLDREISARREYELAVESHLRRELSSELRSQASDEVAALRAELAMLRANLEILFDTDLAHRPALETERTTTRAYSDWDRNDQKPSPDRVSSSRVSPVRHDDTDVRIAESPIIDVPEEPPEPPWVAPMYGGAHRRPSEAAPTPEEQRAWAAEPVPEPPPPWQAQPAYQPEPVAYTPAPPPPPPQPVSRFEPEPERIGRHAPRADQVPADAAGQWPPTGAPDSSWESSLPPPPPPPVPGNGFGADYRGGPRAAPAEPEPPRGRHWSPPESDGEPAEAQSQAEAQHSRHSAPGAGGGPTAPYVPPSQPRPPRPAPTGPERPQPAPQLAQPAPRHRTDEAVVTDDENTGGSSVADLLARLQAGSAPSGGRRRRRED